ncbi:restriction endonuclease subunit S [Mycoplasma enhydrae]|uniref:restriction endonuclease subunit S n=1 Tax=Mycoplasma enhydrae TaxID=2499220 RepID=UPI0021E87DAA|nr:restriction endonuclease subunit S [Mycoplasma enhydrae]MCV3733842.1 restriction endonuclease subunit S [Mycoplasma enhydrae]
MKKNNTEKNEYILFKDICYLKKGTQLNRSLFKDEYKYPVYNGGVVESGFYKDYNTKKNKIVICQGGSAGHVNFITENFWAGAHLYIVEMNSKANFNYKFLYYFLKNNQRKLISSKYGAGIPALAKSDIENLKIPNMPLEKQDKIVKILDNFTTLKAELKAELKAREKQYQFYLDYLLNNKKTTNYLHQICNVDRKINNWPFNKNNLVRKFKHTSAKNVKSIQQNEKGDIALSTTSSEFSYTCIDNVKTKNLINNSEVIFVPSGGEANIKYWNGKFIDSGNILLLKKDNSLNLKFIFYFLVSNKKRLSSFYRGAGIKHPDMISLMNLQVPILPIKVQNEIVNILDKFNAYTNDTTQGLLKEIELREKQYQYYLNKLMNLK